jgi:hypothetical protein
MVKLEKAALGCQKNVDRVTMQIKQVGRILFHK